MDGEEFRELKSSMSGVRRTCRYLKYISMICLVAFSVAWCVLLGVLISGFMADWADFGGGQEILYAFFYGLVINALLFSSVRSFSDVVGGASPFTMRQVTRFRVAALLLVVLAVVDAVLSVGFSYGFDFAGANFGVHGNLGIDQSQMSINVMALFFATVLYGVSVLFRYGVLLQRLTDETE